MGSDAQIIDAMRRALALAATAGVPLGPNPRVGCVLLAPDGTVVGEGFHRGAGTPHAEAAALTHAGVRAAGATAVVTLEPCNHTGRTGPCAQALIEAGVTEVVYAMADPNPRAAGGAATLAAAGIRVRRGIEVEAATQLNRAWLFGLTHQRPLVTWKFATSLDGRSAAADGTSQWISSRAARHDAHRLRGQVDTILVGTGTALIDNPALTVRNDAGRLQQHQPLRAVMGLRDLPPTAQLRDGAAAFMQLPTRKPAEALATLFAAGRRHVLLEGGAQLGAAFLRAHLVDDVVAYIAPVLLGAGAATVGELGITTIGEAQRLRITASTLIGEGADANVKLTLVPKESSS